jgi:hypothetical protein
MPSQEQKDRWPAEITIPDYLSLGTFDIVKTMLDSETLSTRESQSLDYGTVGECFNVIEKQIAERTTKMTQLKREIELCEN